MGDFGGTIDHMCKDDIRSDMVLCDYVCLCILLSLVVFVDVDLSVCLDSR